MKKINYFLAILFLISCNNTIKKPLEPSNKKLLSKELQDSITFKLCQMYGLDQGIRQREFFEGLDKETAVKIDSVNFYSLFEIIEKHGFPNTSLISERI